jgi:hypothetical protein
MERVCIREHTGADTRTRTSIYSANTRKYLNIRIHKYLRAKRVRILDTREYWTCICAFIESVSPRYTRIITYLSNIHHRKT